MGTFPLRAGIASIETGMDLATLPFDLGLGDNLAMPMTALVREGTGCVAASQIKIGWIGVVRTMQSGLSSMAPRQMITPNHARSM